MVRRCVACAFGAKQTHFGAARLPMMMCVGVGVCVQDE
jgi:hypothetical protein